MKVATRRFATRRFATHQIRFLGLLLASLAGCGGQAEPPAAHSVRAPAADVPAPEPKNTSAGDHAAVGPGIQTQADTDSSGRTTAVPPVRPAAPPPGLPKQIEGADLSVLFIGNSHTSGWNLPGVVAEFARGSDPAAKVLCYTAPFGAFLADHIRQPKTLGLLTAGPWDCVVLQAQKYSTSGRYTYPHDAAVKLSEIATRNGARVIMFPEWGRHGNAAEGRRVHALHEKIAAITGARVAPVGLAWDEVLRQRPDLQLHESDGNHANETGTYLTAAVLAATITGKKNRPGRSTTDETRRFLEEQAWQVVSRHQAGEKDGPSESR